LIGFGFGGEPSSACLALGLEVYYSMKPILFLATALFIAGCATDPAERTVPLEWPLQEGVYKRGTITEPAGGEPRDGIHMPGGVHPGEVETLFENDPLPLKPERDETEPE
jgi:hypothetical protein